MHVFACKYFVRLRCMETVSNQITQLCVDVITKPCQGLSYYSIVKEASWLRRSTLAYLWFILRLVAVLDDEYVRCSHSLTLAVNLVNWQWPQMHVFYNPLGLFTLHFVIRWLININSFVYKKGLHRIANTEFIRGTSTIYIYIHQPSNECVLKLKSGHNVCSR